MFGLAGIQVHVADPWRPVHVVDAREFAENIRAVVTALENALTDLVEAHGKRAAKVKEPGCLT